MSPDPGHFRPRNESVSDDYRPLFTRRVYPVLRRAFDYRWVIQQAMRHAADLTISTRWARPQARRGSEQNIRA